MMSRQAAETYASWFRCMSDPTRLLVLHVLASAPQPMRVGEVADAVGIAQSTASVHLQRLLHEEFVLCERVATASLYVVNEACIEQFPRAAEMVMGTLSGSASGPRRGAPVVAPWRQRGAAREQKP